MSRARKVEKNELNKLVKEINRRMGDFEDSVQKLTDLKDTLDEVDENLAQQAAINKHKLDQLNKDFQENKIKAVNQAVSDLGKVLITEEELAELRAELEKVKESGKQEVADAISSSKALLAEKLEQSIQVKQLKHECETAQIRAEVETYKKEVENLNATLQRMSDELTSQKQLTADVAGMSRPKPPASPK